MRMRLIDYLPPILKDVLEFKYLTRTEQIIFDALYEASENTLNEQFVLTASEKGISRYESIFGITPKATDSLEVRRQRIIIKMSDSLPYTYKMLLNRLDALLGEGEYSVITNFNEYELELIAHTINCTANDLIELLRDMLPANLKHGLSMVFDDIVHTAHTGGKLANDVKTPLVTEPDTFNFDHTIYAGGRFTKIPSFSIPESARLPTAEHAFRFGGWVEHISSMPIPPAPEIHNYNVMETVGRIGGTVESVSKIPVAAEG